MPIKSYHEQLCHDYCATSHSDTLVLFNIAHGLVYVAEFDLTPELLQAVTYLERHSSGQLRLRFAGSNRVFRAVARKFANASERVLCSVKELEHDQKTVRAMYPTVKPRTFNRGRVLEYTYARIIGAKWHYDPLEPPYYLASDIEHNGQRMQLKTMKASISERSIINAVAHCNA